MAIGSASLADIFESEERGQKVCRSSGSVASTYLLTFLLVDGHL